MKDVCGNLTFTDNHFKAICALCGEEKSCTWQDTTDGSIECYCDDCLRDYGWNIPQETKD